MSSNLMRSANSLGNCTWVAAWHTAAKDQHWTIYHSYHAPQFPMRKFSITLVDSNSKNLWLRQPVMTGWNRQWSLWTKNSSCMPHPEMDQRSKHWWVESWQGTPCRHSTPWSLKSSMCNAGLIGSDRPGLSPSHLHDDHQIDCKIISW